MRTRLAVLLSCHNRRVTTLSCLDGLFSQKLPDEVELTAFLVDSGSTDGTADAVNNCFRQVRLYRGDSSLFWASGMRWAFEEAIKDDFDFYLWLNDDTFLNQDAVARLLATYGNIAPLSGSKAIIVGSTRDPATGAHTYGGYVSCSRFHPMKYRLVKPGDKPIACDTMNGNLVLIPRPVVGKVHNIKTEFRHAIGDFDYGLRARQQGCKIWIAPGYIGSCPHNGSRGTHLDKTLPLHTRWQKLVSVKGLPPHDYWIFMRQHGGPLWPIFWAMPYLRVLLTSCLPTR